MFYTRLRLVGLTNVDFPMASTDQVGTVVGLSSSTPFIVKTIEGLGPPQFDLAMGVNLSGGGVYQNRRAQTREIVITTKLNPAYASNQKVSDLRSILYGLLTPGTSNQIKVELWDDVANNVVAYTYGYVKGLDSSQFDKDPNAQITIECPSPYLTAPNYVAAVQSSLSKTAPTIVNPGNAPTGFYMEIAFTAAVTNFILTTSDSSKKLQVNYAFLTGDTLQIDTRQGSRSIMLIRSNTVYYLIGALSSDSTWLQILGGTNTFTTSSSAFTYNAYYFTPLYWGV